MLPSSHLGLDELSFPSPHISLHSVGETLTNPLGHTISHFPLLPLSNSLTHPKQGLSSVQS